MDTDAWGRCLRCGGSVTSGGCPTCDTASYRVTGSSDPRDAEIARGRLSIRRRRTVTCLTCPVWFRLLPYKGDCHQLVGSQTCRDLRAGRIPPGPRDPRDVEIMRLRGRLAVAEAAREAACRERDQAVKAWEWLRRRPWLYVTTGDEKLFGVLSTIEGESWLVLPTHANPLTAVTAAMEEGK